MKSLTAIAIVVALAGALQAQDTTTNLFYQRRTSAIEEESPREFQFLAFAYTQLVTTNVFPTNDFLKGQVVGRLFGGNTTNTSDSLTPFYVEQRFLPFFIYQPKLFNGKAIFRASFEIDYTWGDVAYGTGGNFGSAISADQVNIQTQNIEMEFLPAPGWQVNLGLQRMFDTPQNPYRTFFSDMTETAYRLHYWGTDGVGLSVRYQTDYWMAKGGFYQLYENKIQSADDVTLTELQFRRLLTPDLAAGISLYYVSDRANGAGGPSILGQGLNSTLNGYNGVYRFPLQGDYKADIFWLGGYWGYNESIMQDQWFCTGYLNANLGRVSTAEADGQYTKRADIVGLAANLRGGFRYGQTRNDRVWADLLYTSGDDNGLADSRYSGVLTGNMWGTPAALPISMGTYLLFPHGNVVNRYVAAITDISNIGYGLTGGTINVSHDLSPHQLTAKATLGAAMSNAAPSGGGTFMGTEGNVSLTWSFGPFMSLEWHTAYLWLGDFYDSRLVNANAEERPPNPWLSFMAFRWLMF
jgi:hypothetical protein